MANLRANWIKSDANSNTILRGADFYISFNPSPVKSQHIETALVDARNLPQRPIFLLAGDHREAYENLIKLGFEACYHYYLSKLN